MLTAKTVLSRCLAALASSLLWSVLAFAGGPRYAVSGAPITWPNGTIYYYTDQGDLSPLLPGP
ncbi:MAG: hypothetical protein M3O09_08635, partial [Acidobacteriota bacterium]|nr:hypothetical protein [Acidobacteriota bacterium]